MTVAIDPVDGYNNMDVDVSKVIRAFIRDSSGNLVVQPVQWSIDDPSVGEFSSTTSMNTTFTPRKAGGAAVITLTCLGISDTVNVSVAP